METLNIESTYRDVVVYFYSTNIFGFKDPIKNHKRVKIWISNNASNVTDIEFLLNEKEEINLGELKKIKIMVLSPVFFDTLVKSGYRIFFGEILDKRFGELIPIVDASKSA